MPTPIQPAPTVKQNLAQSGAELRAFVASLKGKSAAEAMGVVARSGLTRGLMISLIVQAVALAALTVPYALWPKAPNAVATPQQASPREASGPQALTPTTVPTSQRVERDVARPGPKKTAPTTAPPARTIKPATGDPDDLDAADAIDRGVEQ